jgi:cytochrome P450
VDRWPSTYQEVRVTTGFTFDRFSAGDGADPRPLFRRLREERPVFYAEEFDVWVVSRYDDVRRVLMDPTRFSSAFPIRTPPVPAPGVAEILATGHPEVAALLNEDPPEHRRTRELVARTFTARRIAGLEPAVVDIVTGLLDAIETRGGTDLVADLADPLPLQVICALIGLPPGDPPRIGAWTRQLAVLTSFGSSDEEQRAAAYESVDFERYLATAVTDRRREPRDDLLTDLIRVRADGSPPLSDPELISLLSR